MLGVIVPLYVTLGSFGLVGRNTQAAAMNVDPPRRRFSITGSTTFAMGTAVSASPASCTTAPRGASLLISRSSAFGRLYGLATDGTPRPLAGR